MANTVFIALGSNIQPAANLVKAVRLLEAYGTVIHLSSVYQTAPQGYTDQADFLNMAVKMETSLTIEAFKAALTDIEQQLKRVRDPQNKNTPRTIDLDIALWNDEVRDYGAKPWHVPDKDIARFAHVALPLAEIAPDYQHPETGQSLRDIADTFDASAFQLRKDVFKD